MSRTIRLLLRVAVYLLLAATANAERVQLSPFGGSVDLPYGWHRVAGGGGPLLEGAGRTISAFSDSSGAAELRVVEQPASPGLTSKNFSAAIVSETGGHGDGAGFTYSGKQAYIVDLKLSSNGAGLRGYLITIIGQTKDVALLAVAFEERWESLHDELLSSLDSYAFDGEEVESPGPISQFSYPFPAPGGEHFELHVGSAVVPTTVDVREIEASQTVIDRETRVLAENKAMNVAAWRRYYRMIFRDNYRRVSPYVEPVARALGLSGESQAKQAATLLAWMQRFLYARTGTLSDLSDPLLTLLTQSGDCDSRTLLYSILLRHLGIQSVLMVSAVYSHSMVGALVEGNGARFEHGGKRYLVAELTVPVAIGMIDRTMADPNGWVPVDFPAGE